MLEEQKEDHWRISWSIVIEQEDGGRGNQRYRWGQGGGAGHHQGRSRQKTMLWNTIPGVLSTLTFPSDFAPLSQILIVFTFSSLGVFWPLSTTSVLDQEACFGKQLCIKKGSWFWVQKILDLNCMGSWGNLLNFSESLFSQNLAGNLGGLQVVQVEFFGVTQCVCHIVVKV